MRFFSSDIHFDDMDTIVNDNRPFKSTKSFDKYLIRTWNKQVKKDDVIYVIGDFVDCDGEGYDSWKKSLHNVKKIKASVILIMGNNEERVVKYFFDNDFEKFRKYCIDVGFINVFKELDISFKGKDLHLTHKLINCDEDKLNLFGHSHRSIGIYTPFGFNIGCDLNHFRLYSEDDIEKLLVMKEKYWVKDKNLNKIFSYNKD
jgi:calcineurin-like phosphoesterase family protein